jgi:hypothetical protein
MLLYLGYPCESEEQLSVLHGLKFYLEITASPRDLADVSVMDFGWTNVGVVLRAQSDLRLTRCRLTDRASAAATCPSRHYPMFL